MDPKLSRNLGKRIDHLRLERFQPVEGAVLNLNLPLLRFRKLNGIMSALIMQIEDGGDSPDVNDYLIQALRSAVIHQAGADAAQLVLQEIDAFQASEMVRRKQIQQGEPPEIQLSSVEQFIEYMESGYDAVDESDVQAACQEWIRAWEIAKTLFHPEMRTRSAVSEAYPDLEVDFDNWCYDFLFELHNAGHDGRTFHEYRLKYVQEFLDQFPDEDEDIRLNFGRGRGEALWELGRRVEAENAYTDLVQRFPDEAWAYIGWADQYWLGYDAEKQFERAESILRQALDRPQLNDLEDVFERLIELYTDWGKPDKVKMARQEWHKATRPERLAAFQANLGEAKGGKHTKRGRRKKKNR